MTSFPRKITDAYGPLALLGAGVLLQGAKTALSFFVWGTLALLWSLAILIRRDQNHRQDLLTGKEIILLLSILCAQIFSLDRSGSLFKTLEALVFLFLWVAYKSDKTLLCEEHPLQKILWGLASLTIGITSVQLFQKDWTWAYGFLPFNPHFNAAWMGSLAVFFIVTAFPRWQHDHRSLAAYFEILLATLLLLLVCFGASRSTLLAILLGLLYAFREEITWRRSLLVLSFMVLFLYITPHHLFLNRLRLTEGFYRPQIWKIAIDTIRRNPLTGIGFGNFETVYQQHAFAVESDPVRFAHTTAFTHNEYLQIGVDIGLPALLVIFFLLRHVLFLTKTIEKSRNRAAQAALFVLCVVAFYNFIWQIPFLLYWTLVLAILALQNHSLEERIKTSPRRPTRESPLWKRPWNTVLGALLLLEVLMGWCAWRDNRLQKHDPLSILRIDPTDASAWQQLGHNQSDPRRASEAYAQALQYAPDQFYFRESYARSLEATQTGSGLSYAMAEYLYALDLAPNRAIDLLAIGRILYRQGAYQEALDWFQRARQTEPRYWECDLWIARCDAKRGHVKRAGWVLENLSKRREEYIGFRERNRQDLPYQDQGLPGQYDREILAYDPSVVKQELISYSH